jgi:two-component system cell cycle response regulator DivK
MTRILYVEDNEDNEDNVYMLTRRLQKHGYEISVARDGEQGLAMARRGRPDLILLDLSLPVLDGWETARRLKQATDTQAIPIIALSAHAMAGDREKALAVGCDDYDTKPVVLKRLLAKMRTLLSVGSGS